MRHAARVKAGPRPRGDVGGLRTRDAGEAAQARPEALPTGLGRARVAVWAASRHRAGPGPGARATPSRATSAARPLRTGPNYARTRLAAAPDLFGKPEPGPFPAPATGCTPLEEARRSGLARERRTALPPQRPRGAAAFAAAAGPSCRLRFPSSNPRPVAQALRKLTTPQAPIRVAAHLRVPAALRRCCSRRSGSPACCGRRRSRSPAAGVPRRSPRRWRRTSRRRYTRGWGRSWWAG